MNTAPGERSEPVSAIIKRYIIRLWYGYYLMVPLYYKITTAVTVNTTHAGPALIKCIVFVVRG